MCCTSWLMIKWSKLNVVSMENANGKCHPNHQFGKKRWYRVHTNSIYNVWYIADDPIPTHS